MRIPKRPKQRRNIGRSIRKARRIEALTQRIAEEWRQRDEREFYHMMHGEAKPAETFCSSKPALDCQELMAEMKAGTNPAKFEAARKACKKYWEDVALAPCYIHTAPLLRVGLFENIIRGDCIRRKGLAF